MDDNKQKSASGNKQDELLKDIAQDALDHGYVSEYHYKYQVGEPGFNNTRQFFCPCELVFDDGEKWLLYTSTSFRSDRAKEWHWDASNIKRIDGAEKAYLVYSDSTDKNEQQRFLKAKESYTQKDGLYAIDDVFSETQIENIIQSKGLQNTNYGLLQHIIGNTFEEKVANILSNSENLSKFLHRTEDSSILRGRSYQLFCDILKKTLGPASADISSITATSDSKIIGRLPSGGKPKTDVIVHVHFVNGNDMDITISCKHTDSSMVSVHQYSADAFSNVLDPNNIQLRALLKEFQKNPTLEGFGQKNAALLTNEISSYLDRLILWVLGGKYGTGKPHQIAQYLIVYNDQEYRIHTIEEYSEELKQNKKRHFGTPFSWTYASGQRGKSIQLKCPILK